jgi:hypothetical protein
LGRFSKILLRLHWKEYTQWLGYSFSYTLANFPDPMVIILLLLVLFASFLARSLAVRSAPRKTASMGVNAAMIYAMGIGYFLATIALVVLSELPQSRYTMPTFLFLPSMLLMGIAENIRVAMAAA